MMDNYLISKKFKYQEILIKDYAKVVFLSLEELLAIHREHGMSKNCADSITNFIFKDFYSVCVPYILGPGVSTDRQRCCNGIRYGTDSNYISLPQLPSSIWKSF